MGEEVSYNGTYVENMTVPKRNCVEIFFVLHFVKFLFGMGEDSLMG